MKPSSAERRRCTECRQWFEAAPSARGTQKVCSAACRAKRQRKLARRRRRAHVQQARVEERERQRDSRAKRRAAPERAQDSAASAASLAVPEPGRDGPAAPAGHAPAMRAKSPDTLGKVLDFWDNEMARSRATLERRIAAILRRSAPETGTARDSPSALSRSSLGA
jgi:hypothetical protein